MRALQSEMFLVHFEWQIRGGVRSKPSRTRFDFWKECNVNNMHPDFKNLCDLTISAIVNNEDKCKKIFQDYGLLPTEETEVNCPECSDLMSLSRDPNKAMGFVEMPSLQDLKISLLQDIL